MGNRLGSSPLERATVQEWLRVSSEWIRVRYLPTLWANEHLSAVR